MSEIPEEDYLQLSGIQHFTFCRRQWALIHIEQIWAENLRTIEGALLHENAHDPFFIEKRKDVIITRDLAVFSRAMGVTGKCDIVEFHRDEQQGVKLAGRTGKWRPLPVEYKRGRTKSSDEDRVQLCAQAMCLEEMLACAEIKAGYLYYGQTRHREAIELTVALKETVVNTFAEMHEYCRRRHTPRVKWSKVCNSCSLKDECIPRMPQQSQSVSAYLKHYLLEDASLDAKGNEDPEAIG
jgi:CRISPR-associated exonuclease Cas4